MASTLCGKHQCGNAGAAVSTCEHISGTWWQLPLSRVPSAQVQVLRYVACVLVCRMMQS